jgi:23S rRNA pseudouridine1911/1915/1917 synthase
MMLRVIKNCPRNGARIILQRKFSIKTNYHIVEEQTLLNDISKLVIYEDNHLLALFKPNGVLSQSDITSDLDLLTAAKEYLKIKYSKPGDAFLGLVHRLDRPCSGVMVFAKTSKASSRLCALFRERKIIKKYLAVVEGVVKHGIELDDHSLKHPNINKSIIRKSPSDGSQLSSLSLTPVCELQSEVQSPRMIVTVDLATGRKHQIRAQLSHSGLPILGDRKYGSTQPWPHRRAIALHSYLLSFYHPITDEQVNCYDYIKSTILLTCCSWCSLLLCLKRGYPSLDRLPTHK